MSAQCRAVERNGEPCKGAVTGPHGYCWAHAPENAEQRKRMASKAARSKPNKEVRAVKDRLEDLADGVLLGTIDKADAAVVAQIWNTYLRAVSVELKVREVEDLEQRLSDLEELLQHKGGRRGA